MGFTPTVLAQGTTVSGNATETVPASTTWHILGIAINGGGNAEEWTVELEGIVVARVTVDTGKPTFNFCVAEDAGVEGSCPNLMALAGNDVEIQRVSGSTNVDYTIWGYAIT